MVRVRVRVRVRVWVWVGKLHQTQTHMQLSSL